MTPLAPEPRHSVEALSFLYVCLGGRADGDYESSLEIHVPQAFAADGCAMFCAFSAATAAAMDRGQFQNVPPEIREWFENMRSPKGIMCCSYADGHRTGYDIRQGQYWVPIDGDWYPVPPEAVIKTENPVGEAIVWYLLQSPDSGLPHSELYKIICFNSVGRRLISLTR
jgi:hypothetical protein